MRTNPGLVKVAKWAIIGIVILVLVLVVGRNFAYFFVVVEEQESAVQFRGGRIHNIVGPGVYSDVGLFVRISKISCQAIPFEVSDPELITRDKQRIGLIVSGDIFRPCIRDGDMLRQMWAEYRGLYLQNDLMASRVQSLAKQAMKVCAGDRTFEQSVIGTARDELRTCIDTELNDMTGKFGASVANVAVPEIVISAEVQAALDSIVQSRLMTEKAAQDELKALAEAEAEQARQEGEIRVEQSRIQEQTRQQTLLSQLESERLAAQLAVIQAQRTNDLAQLERERAVIESTKANELLSAERDLEINEALAKAALAKAQADLAYNAALADLYTANPTFLQLQLVQANADALNATDKVIFVPEGTMPTIVLPGEGIVPTIDTGATTQP